MIFKKTLFKKNILALIALLISYTSYSRLTAGSSLTSFQLIQTKVFGCNVTAANRAHNGAPLALSS